MADGQVTRNTEIVKPNVRKVRTMIDGSVIGGFAGEKASTPYLNLSEPQRMVSSICLHDSHAEHCLTMQAQQPMPSPSSSASKANWKPTQVSCTLSSHNPPTPHKH